MIENKVRVRRSRLGRPSQGDILRDVECIESVSEKSGVIQVSKIVFPLVVVLTQDCDLEQNARYNSEESRPNSDDKRLFSVLVAPLYNAEHVFQGIHLEDLSLKMQMIPKSKTAGISLIQNERPRYHYLDFPADIPLVAQIVDFKHYFSLSIAYIEKIRSKKFVCCISELFREDLSQRFAAYLSRIGLPTPPLPKPNQPRPAATNARAANAATSVL